MLEVEAHYITALLVVLKAFGDPRGRGNKVPVWAKIIPWKISMLSQNDARFHDSIQAEEIFDSIVCKNQTNPFRHWSIEYNAKTNQTLSTLYDFLVPTDWNKYFEWMT